MKDSVYLSVVMPALNEEKLLKSAVEAVLLSFDRMKIPGEVIVINDGSRDRTGDIAEELKREYNNVRVIKHAKPMGVGASFWDGVENAHGEVVTMLPGDGENDPFEILRYVHLMEHVDIIIPFVYNREVRSLRRQLVSKLYKSIINLSFGMLLNYMNGTVMYRRSVLLDIGLRSKGFFYQTELLIKAIRKGYLYCEVPYALGERGVGKSKALTLSSFIKLSKDYLRTLAAVFFPKHDQKYLENTKTFVRRQGLPEQIEAPPLPLSNGENLGESIT